tara:strand:+ start:140 stop:388 length:249 start_codon:yes stop_codon:yes gene_type:complete
MLNEEVVVITKLQKYLKDNYHSIGENMMSGGVDNMEKYKYMLGKAHAYATILQEISNLLKPKEQNEDERDNTNVIKFGSPED